MPAPTQITPATKRELKAIGGKLKRARLLRRLPMDVVAERAGTTRPTLQRVEAGDPNVRAATYLMIMQALGLLKTLELTDPLDTELSNEHLPVRVRGKNGSRSSAMRSDAPYPSHSSSILLPDG